MYPYMPAAGETEPNPDWAGPDDVHGTADDKPDPAPWVIRVEATFRVQLRSNQRWHSRIDNLASRLKKLSPFDYASSCSARACLPRRPGSGLSDSNRSVRPLWNLCRGSSGPWRPPLLEVVSVKDALDPSLGASDGSGYAETTDYTVQTSSGTITRIGTGEIGDGRLINVTYQYISSDYFLPVRCYDLGTVESRYGSSLTPDGTAINSVLSYAASIAFENGASSIVCQPLFARGTPGDPTTPQHQPSDTEAAAISSWSDTLYSLRDIEDINIIVPIVGQSAPNVGDATLLSIFQTIQDHAYFMAQQDQYIVGLFGEDSSASNTVAQKAVIQQHASILARSLRRRCCRAVGPHQRF
jgi:hypothetical protein